MSPETNDQGNAKSNSCHLQDEFNRGCFQFVGDACFVEKIKDGRNDNEIDQGKAKNSVPEFSVDTTTG